MTTTRRKKEKKPNSIALNQTQGIMRLPALIRAIRDGEIIDFKACEKLLFERVGLYSRTPNANNEVSPLTVAIIENQPEVFTAILTVMRSLNQQQALVHKIFVESLRAAITLKRFSMYRQLTDIIGVNQIIHTAFDKNNNITIGYFPIHWAVQHDNREVLEDLLANQKVDPNQAREGDQLTALHLACVLENNSLVNMLLEMGSDIEKRFLHGDNALHFSVTQKNASIIQSLIKRGADINVTREDGYTPVSSAVWVDTFEIFKLFVESGADINKGGISNSPMSCACRLGRIGYVEYLYSKGAFVDDQYLAFASRHNHLDVIKFLIEKTGTNLLFKDNNKLTALYYACYAGAYEAAELLLNYASQKGQQVVDELLHVKDKNGNTLLASILDLKRPKILLLLFKYNVDILQPMLKNRTVLHLVWFCSNADEVINLLLMRIKIINNVANVDQSVKRIDVNCKDYKGRTPLHYFGIYATKYLFANGIKHLDQLIELGACIDECDMHSLTPLYYAAALDNYEMINSFIARGADINRVLKAAIENSNLVVLYNLLHLTKSIEPELIEELIKFSSQKELQGHDYIKPVRNKLGIFISREMMEQLALESNTNTNNLNISENTEIKQHTTENKKTINQSSSVNDSCYANAYSFFQTSGSSVPSRHAYFQSLGFEKAEISGFLQKDDENKEDKSKSTPFKSESKKFETVFAWGRGVLSSAMPEVKTIRNMHENVKFYCPPDVIPESHSDIFNIDAPKRVSAPKGDQGIKFLTGREFGSFTVYVGDKIYRDRKITCEFTTKKKEHKKNRLYMIEIPGDAGGSLLVPILFSENGIHNLSEIKSLETSAEFSKPIHIKLPEKPIPRV